MSAHPLSPREREILELRSLGHNRAQIAAMLYLSPNTVAKHLSHAYNKLHARDAAHAVAIALRTGQLT